MRKLLDLGRRVAVYDSMYSGDHFLPRRDLNPKMVKGDIRDAAKLAQEFKGIVAVINLACISNDTSFELNEKLCTSINLKAVTP